MTLSFLFHPHKDECRTTHLLLWGGARSGKTSILYRWKLGLSIPTVNTVGLLQEEFYYARKRRLTDQGPSGARTASTITTCATDDEASCRADLDEEPAMVRVNICEVGRHPSSVESHNDYSIARQIECGEDGVGSSADERTSVVLMLLQALCCCRVPPEDYSYGARSVNTTAYLTFLNLWCISVSKADGVIYVIDCSSQKSMQDACEDISMILHNDSLRRKGAKLLILANKQDVYGAFGALHINEMLRLQQTGRVKLVTCSAFTGDGLEEGLDWITQPETSKKL